MGEKAETKTDEVYTTLKLHSKISVMQAWESREIDINTYNKCWEP